VSSVLVVAHPDDEVMWFGGLVLTDRGPWTIICCSVPRRDSIRAWKFFDACETLGANARLIPSVEPEPGEPFCDDIMDLPDLEGYDRIVTHGVEGEYGHFHHKNLHEFIHRKYAHKEIWSCCPSGKSDYAVRRDLTPDQALRKRAALDCYNHVLLYEGVPMTKADALIKRYCTDGEWEFDVERYRIHKR